MQTLFDLSEEYDRMLAQGLQLSGEDKHYFIAGRLAGLKRRLPRAFHPRRVLDFGCGTGDATAKLAELYPGSEVVGVDTAERALEVARRERGSRRVSFGPVDGLAKNGIFDLCYVNGVFHHIERRRRAEAVRSILAALAPGGYFALFENNPLNPGTRLVMHRIPFDRDAQLLSHREARKLLQREGFEVLGASFYFYFPRALSALRGLEPALAGLPLGAQYLVLGRTPAVRSSSTVSA